MTNINFFQDRERSCLFFPGVSEEEFELLGYYFKSTGTKLKDLGQMFSGENDSVYYSRKMDDRILEEAEGFSLNSICIGKTSESKLLFDRGVSSFWNISNINILYSLSHVFSHIKRENENVLIWTGVDLFNKHASNILKRYGFNVLVTKNPVEAIFALSNQKYQFLLIDWDSCGMETLKLLRELKSFKTTQKENFPLILGIKNFEKVNVFRDLSMGIRDFCPVLFSYREIVELFIRSFSVSKHNDKSNIDTKPVIKSKEGYFKLVERPDSSREFIDIYESFELSVFSFQFSWLLSFF